MNLNRFWMILWKRLWMIVLLFAVTMTVILVSAMTAKPVYEAAVRLQVIPMESEQVGLYGPIRSSSTTDPIDLTVYGFTQMVRSGTVAWRTIAQLGLDMDAETLLRGLNASQDSDFVTVVAQADTPQAAEAIVSAQVDNALTAYRTDRARPAVVTGDFLTQQLATAEQTLAAAENDLLRFNLNHNIDSLDRELTAYQDTVRDLRKSKDNATLEAARLTAQVSALESEAAAMDAAAARAAAATAAEAAAQAEAGPITATSVTPRPTPAKSDAELSALRHADDMRTTAATLRAQLAGQQALEAEYDRSIARWETDLTSLIGLKDEYQRLNNAVKQAQDNRDFLSSKAMEAQLKQQQGLDVGYLKIVEPARRPDQPIPNRTLQIALVGGVLSLVAGVILAFIFEFIEMLRLGPPQSA